MTAHFEAKKHAYRQTQDGIVVSFVVHPNDISSALAVAPLGTRYMVAFAEIGDDGKPVTPENSPHAAPLNGTNAVAKLDGTEPGNHGIAGTTSKDRRPFASLPLSQQCGMRCADKQFQDYICHTFWNTNVDETTEDYTTLLVKNFLQIESRKELDAEGQTLAKMEWARLDGMYQAHLTDIQYAGAKR